MFILDFHFGIRESQYPEFESVLLDIDTDVQQLLGFRKFRKGNSVWYESHMEFEDEAELQHVLIGESLRYLLSAIDSLAFDNQSKVWEKSGEKSIADYFSGADFLNT